MTAQLQLVMLTAASDIIILGVMALPRQVNVYHVPILQMDIDGLVMVTIPIPACPKNATQNVQSVSTILVAIRQRTLENVFRAQILLKVITGPRMAIF
jgi:hypothetical protein